jgi:hypothetical protein
MTLRYPLVRVASQVRAHPLRPWLPHMELRADRTNRREPARREFVGEHLRCARLHRIGVLWRTGQSGSARRVRWGVGVADDHHQEFVGADQHDRRPRGHNRAGKTMTQAVGDVRRQGRRDADAEQPPRQRRNRHLATRRVEQSPSNSRRLARRP